MKYLYRLKTADECLSPIFECEILPPEIKKAIGVDVYSIAEDSLGNATPPCHRSYRVKNRIYCTLVEYEEY